MNNRKRYTTEDIKNNRFYQMPKFLFEDDFKQLSNDARVLYSLLRDRHSLSMTNGWVNNNNEVYLIYTRENMAEILGCSIPTARKAIVSLVKHGLIEEDKQGQGKPNLIYLNDVAIANTKTEKSFLSRKKKDFTLESKEVSTSKTNLSKNDFKETENHLHDLENRGDLHFLKDIESEYVDSYLSIMDLYGYKHKRVSERNLNYILSGIDTLVDYGIDINMWSESVHEHFRKLPKNNDGDIVAFLIASKRYFDVDLKDTIDR